MEETRDQAGGGHLTCLKDTISRAVPVLSSGPYSITWRLFRWGNYFLLVDDTNETQRSKTGGKSLHKPREEQGTQTSNKKPLVPEDYFSRKHYLSLAWFSLCFPQSLHLGQRRCVLSYAGCWETHRCEALSQGTHTHASDQPGFVSIEIYLILVFYFLLKIMSLTDYWLQSCLYWWKSNLSHWRRLCSRSEGTGGSQEIS